MASPLPASLYSQPDRSMSPPGLPMVIPVGILVMVIALIFGFSYYRADDWYVGVAVTVVGVVIVVLMFFVNESQERKHHRPPPLKFDKRIFLLGATVSMLGMSVMLLAGGVLSGFVSTIAVLMGVAMLVGGIFMFIMSLRG